MTSPTRHQRVNLALRREIRAMTIKQLRNLHNAQPFQPFVIHMADCRAVAENHREFIMCVPSGRTVFVAQPDDTVNIIDLLLVTDVELKPAANGSRKRWKS